MVSNVQIEFPVFQLVTIALVLPVSTAKERLAPYVKLCSTNRIPVTSCEITSYFHRENLSFTVCRTVIL